MEVLGAIKSKEMDFLNKVEKIELSQVEDDWVYYDPIGSIYLLRPDIVTESAMRKVLAETGDGISRGAMFVDYASKETSVNMITEVDKEKVRDFMIKALS
jgi:inosine-uridine nucleoside N-ribohydrolase